MTLSPGLRGWVKPLQAHRGVLQTMTRRQTPENKTMLAPYTMCRRASNNEFLKRVPAVRA